MTSSTFGFFRVRRIEQQRLVIGFCSGMLTLLVVAQLRGVRLALAKMNDKKLNGCIQQKPQHLSM